MPPLRYHVARVMGADAFPAEAATYAQTPILVTGTLAAALHNNVCNNRMEFTCRALPLPGGETCVGVWNTDFTWRGVDGEPLLPEGEPSRFSLKLHGRGRAIVRTSPATVRIPPNTSFTLEFDALGKGAVSLLSDADPADLPFKHAVRPGHARLTFASGAAADYVLRFEGLDVLDNVQLYTLDGDK